MFLASVRVVPAGSSLTAEGRGDRMMLDSFRRASRLHEKLLVYPQCTAVPGKEGGGGLGLQARVSREESRRGCPALFYKVGKTRLKH